MSISVTEAQEAQDLTTWRTAAAHENRNPITVQKDLKITCPGRNMLF